MSIKVTEVKGIKIKLHFTLIIVFVLVSWTLAASFMPTQYGGLSVIQYWTMGVIGAVVLFGSVLAHELSHSVVAQRFGIGVKQIVLFIFGGVSDIEEEPKDFKREFSIAIAGPVTSFILSAIFALLWYAAASAFAAVTPHAASLFPPSLTTTSLPSAAPPPLTTTTQVITRMFEGIFFYGMLINVMLGAFNLIPAFPMDGGRVLRALLVKRSKNHDKATKTAVKVGVAISYAFFAFGFIAMITGAFIAGIWILLLGWFLQSGAQSYLYQHDLMSILSRVKLGSIMNSKIIAIPIDLNVERALKDYFVVYMKSSLPVTSNGRKLEGMVDLRAALSVPEPRRASVSVRDIMIPRNVIVVADANQTADMAIKEMARTRIGKVYVCDPRTDRLLGVVSKTDIMNAAGEQQDFLQHYKGRGNNNDDNNNNNSQDDGDDDSHRNGGLNQSEGVAT